MRLVVSYEHNKKILYFDIFESYQHFFTDNFGSVKFFLDTFR